MPILQVSYVPIEGSLKEIIPISSTITAGNISGVFGSLWLLGISACVVAGMGIYAYAGVRYQGVDSGAKETEIKGDIKRATIGVIGVLGLWLLLNQINPELLRGEISLSKPVGSTTSGDSVPVVPQTPVAPGTPTSESSIRTILSNIPININNEGKTCSGGQTTGCTNVQGMRGETISMLRSLRSACSSCEIQITGGTEPGHRSHGIDLFPVDLNLSSSLVTFIKNNGNSVSPASFCNSEYIYLGWRFCDEKNTKPHFHVYP